MAYKYDVFVSYTIAFPFGEWVHKHLIPFLEPYVGNALNRDVVLFIDRGGILAGDAWPQRIKNALITSRCMVAVWSPLYFKSEWCSKELAVMRYREQKLGYRTIANPSGLIFPINVFDGDHFPEYAKEIQYADCRDYARVGDGYKKTSRYVAFQDLLILWANDVAAAINHAPAWSDEWLGKEWIDNPVSQFNHSCVENFGPPRLE